MITAIDQALSRLQTERCHGDTGMRICSLFSGSSGNAIFVCTENTKLLVEAGLSGRKIAEALSSIGESLSEISAVLVSHEHIDHVRGAGVLARRYNLPIFASTGTWEAMEQMIGPVPERNKKVFSTYVPFEIGDITITPFPIPHDANEPVGYSFSSAGKKATIATDIGHISMDLLRNFEDSDLLLLESNHDIEMLRMGPYPWPLKQRIAGKQGHLSNDAAGEVIAYMAERGTRKFLLGHLSKENNFPELAYQTVRSVLCEKCVNADSGISLDVALRDRVSRIIEI